MHILGSLHIFAYFGKVCIILHILRSFCTKVKRKHKHFLQTSRNLGILSILFSKTNLKTWKSLAALKEKNEKRIEMSTVNKIIKEFGGPKVWDFNKATNFYFCKICSVTCERRFLLRHTARISENSVKKNSHFYWSYFQNLQVLRIILMYGTKSCM